MKSSILKIRKLMFIYFCKHNRNLMNEEFSVPKIKMIKKKEKKSLSKKSITQKKNDFKSKKFSLENQIDNKINICV